MSADHPISLPRRVKDLSGQKFGRLQVVAFHSVDKNRMAMWLCRCDCGIERPISGNSLRRGLSQSCGCINKDRPRIGDISGRVFGRLRVIEYACTIKQVSHWRCVCECGKERVVAHNSLTTGNTRSCGCFNRDQVIASQKTHGMTRSREFRCWQQMIQRCTNTNYKNYHYYGGRGISVCQEWLVSFQAFHEHIGLAPTRKHTVDRYPDQNGNYEPGNVRWATQKEQSRNMRRNRLITIGERTQCVTDWASEVGLNRATLMNRLESGWDESAAVFTPVRPDSTKRHAATASAAVAKHLL